jgi:hypothetical protein
MDPMIAALLRPEAYGHPVETLELLETHASWVILTGAYAYKLKKPVNFGFLDFSSPEQRLHCCREELRLNRRLSPDLYLGLAAVHGPAERASFQGDGPVIEHAVRMRQFPQADLLPAALCRGAVGAAAFDAFAEDLARFQAGAAVAIFGRNEDKNAKVLAELSEAGAHATAVNVDLTDRASLEPAVRHVEAEAEGRTGARRLGTERIELGKPRPERPHHIARHGRDLLKPLASRFGSGRGTLPGHRSVDRRPKLVIPLLVEGRLASAESRCSGCRHPSAMGAQKMCRDWPHDSRGTLAEVHSAHAQRTDRVGWPVRLLHRRNRGARAKRAAAACRCAIARHRHCSNCTCS